MDVKAEHVAGDDWAREEVEATVGDYFLMLREELAGIPVNKAQHNERLRPLLRARSKGSVEFKHANISTVLTLYGYPYIDGYKPRFNFQALLEQVVLEYLDVHRDFFDPLLDGPVLNPTAAPKSGAFDVGGVVEAYSIDENAGLSKRKSSSTAQSSLCDSSTAQSDTVVGSDSNG